MLDAVVRLLHPVFVPALQLPVPQLKVEPNGGGASFKAPHGAPSARMPSPPDSRLAAAPQLPPIKLLVNALCLAGSWTCPRATATPPTTAAATSASSDTDTDEQDPPSCSSPKPPPTPEPVAPTFAAWSICREWRDALRGSIHHLAALLIAAHGPERALARAIACASPVVDRDALVRRLLLTCHTTKGLEEALIEAARRGCDDTVRLLLRQDPSLAPRPDCQDGMALVAAAAAGHEPVVRTLLTWPKHPAKANSLDHQALVDACTGGHTGVVALLLSQPPGSAPRADVNDCQAFYDACEAGHAGVVRALLTAPQGSRPVADDWALVCAARGGSARVVRLLLRWPVNPPAANANRCQAMVAAAAGGHMEVVRQLLTAPQDAAAADAGGSHQAVLQAAQGGHTATVRLLLQQSSNASPADCMNGQALANAAEAGCKSLVLLLLNWPVNPCPPSATALAMAVRGGHTAIARILLRAGAKPTDHLLNEAASGGHVQLGRLLLRMYPHTIRANGNQNSALLAAARKGRAEFVSMLMGWPAHAPRAASFGAAVVEAAKHGHIVVVRMLLDAPGAPSPDCAALRGASEGGHAATVRLLLRRMRAARPMDWTYNGTVASVAARGHAEVLRLLLSAWEEWEAAAPAGPSTAGSPTHGAPVPTPPALASKQANALTNALLEASGAGRGDAVRVLLEWRHPARPAANALDSQALMRAAERGQLAVVRLLLTWPESPCHADAQDGAALAFASGGSHMEVVKELLMSPEHAPPADAQGGQALVEACRRGHADMARALLSWPHRAPHADCQDGEGLVQACACGDDDLVRLLLEYPEHAPRADCQDGEALVAAASRGNTSTMELLLDWPHNAPPANCRGGAALIAAAKSWREEAALILLTDPVHPCRADCRDGEALIQAVELGNSLSIVQLLLSYPVHAPRPDVQNGRALVAAVRRRCKARLGNLLEHDPDATAIRAAAAQCRDSGLYVMLHEALEKAETAQALAAGR